MSDKSSRSSADLALFANWGLVTLTVVELLKLIVLAFLAGHLHDRSEGFVEGLSAFAVRLTVEGVFLPCCAIAAVGIVGLIGKELVVPDVRVRLAINLIAFACSSLLVWGFLLNVMLPIFAALYSVSS
jgi:hypothetical protein